ncbi:hypothetical protein R1flu_028474 [Riccia fluitans]|uniref:HMA domain-containing protein n=1 Tax=Riccia fluitans TaxID=41844 RepID=A0ABD1XPM6_9MARC
MARVLMQLLNRRTWKVNSKLPSKLASMQSPKMIELKVPMCCECCEENVREELIVLEGVKEISIDMNVQKVVVVSHYDAKLEPSVVLDAVKKVKHRAELWRKQSQNHLSTSMPVKIE